MSDTPWAPVLAVRGYGMLIDGRRVGLYNQVEMKVNGRQVHWGVGYLLITTDEWLKLNKRIFDLSNPPAVSITYATGIPPETATISRAFIRERKQLFPDETPFYLGAETRWNAEAPSLTELQDLVLELNDWVDSCFVS